MRKLMAAAAALALAIPGVANAAFVVNYTASDPVPTTPPLGPNNFAAALAATAQNITKFASSGVTSLALTSSGLIKFEFFGKEALKTNKFTVGSLSYTATATPVVQNHFGAAFGGDNTPFNIGSINLTPATFNPQFFINGGGAPYGPGSENFGVGLSGSAPASGSYLTNTLWLLFDDKTTDDNHDDLVIRATFVVPELSTWAMMLAGFGIMGLLMRSRRTARVSFV